MKEKIVILDGHVANPGDLSWDALSALGELTVYGSCMAAFPLSWHTTYWPVFCGPWGTARHR